MPLNYIIYIDYTIINKQTDDAKKKPNRSRKKDQNDREKERPNTMSNPNNQGVCATPDANSAAWHLVLTGAHAAGKTFMLHAARRRMICTLCQIHPWLTKRRILSPFEHVFRSADLKMQQSAKAWKGWPNRWNERRRNSMAQCP